MPWKNGLGTTREIAIHPPGAALDDFDWRLSIADMRASGPFSTFPGYDRILVQTEGRPMTLTHEGADPHRLRLLEPYRFEGELGTCCTLEHSPARDFNVMFRRDRVSADVVVGELVDGATLRTDASAVHMLLGSASVEAGGVHHGVVSGETLITSDVTPFVITASSGGALALLVTLRPTRR